MISVLHEIGKIRQDNPINIDYKNNNRYRVLVNEKNGTKTAYYFSCPIYNAKTRKAVDLKFDKKDGAIYSVGSNSNITFSNGVRMENSEGFCLIDLRQKCNLVSSQEVHCGSVVLTPTINGVALKCAIKSDEKAVFVVDVGQSFLQVRANDKCFALMKERFKPFVVFSCVGSIDTIGNVIAPAKIEYQKITDKKYRIVVTTTSSAAKYVLFEANLYENKLFQDTTVESTNPSVNNAFGSVGFIGNTSLYGEQWLYSKLDYSRTSEIMDKQIHKAVLHMPKLNQNRTELSAYKVSSRFCSFGSNWNNRITGNIQISDLYLQSGYQSLDFTSLLVDERTKTIVKSEGFILKPKIKGVGFSVIATADSNFAPQIMEINFG